VHLQVKSVVRTRNYILILALGFLVGACRRGVEQPQNANSESVTKPVAPSALTDKWLGRWNGPEGTFLVLSKNGEKYVVKINSLDGPETYEGVWMGDHIEFVREGKRESIRAGSGADTGMKWLLDEKNCLFIKKSEGFCR
jgi:hypothetical protein